MDYKEPRIIENFPNYCVYKDGTVERLAYTAFYSNGIEAYHKPKILKQETLKRGYKRVTLSYKGKVKRFSVHRLVAICYINNKSNKPVVNHIDGNPSNNNVSNLEWCTYQENEQHSYKVLGKINNRRKLTMKQVAEIKLLYHSTKKHSSRFMGLLYNVNHGTILDIVNEVSYV